MMRNLLFALLALLCFLPSRSQSADGRYASRMTQDGTIFFIMPQKIGVTEGIQRFEYDMTLLSWTDSVTINFTFQSAIMERPTSLSIGNKDENFKCTDYSLLFLDIKKNKYEIRVTSKFAASDIKQLIDSPSPMTFRFVQGGQERSATYKEKAWEKDRKKLNDIYKIYLYSK